MAEENENEPVSLDVMPGADKLEAPENIDLNFPEEEVTDETPAEESAEIESSNESSEEEESVSEQTEENDEEGVLEEAAETEAKAESEAEPEQEQPKKPMVPKSRLDEVLAKQKALQKQLDDLKAQNEKPEDAPEEYEFAKKEVEYQNLLLDGEAEKAAALRQEIRKAERDQISYEMRQEMSQKVAHNQQATALQTAAADLEANFPVFDQNSESFNKEYTQEVVDLRDAFITQGYGAVDALSKAANFVIKSYDIAEPAPSLGTESKKPSTDEVAKKRAEVDRKIKAAEAQPPELTGESSANKGEKAMDVTTMSEEEFNALPEATLKRLRGDIL